MLVFSGHKRFAIDHTKMFSRDKVHIDDIDRFWSFEKERLAKYHKARKISAVHQRDGVNIRQQGCGSVFNFAGLSIEDTE